MACTLERTSQHAVSLFPTASLRDTKDYNQGREIPLKSRLIIRSVGRTDGRALIH